MPRRHKPQVLTTVSWCGFNHPMKKYAVILSAFAFLLTTTPASAAEVTKVENGKAWIKKDAGEKFLVGDQVQFMNDNLEPAGTAVIEKISSGGTTMTAQIRSGKVTKGLMLERTGGSSSDKTNEVSAPAADSAKSSYQLTESERKILDIGEISTQRYVIGGVLGTYPLGLGIGHAIQGRYSDKGWIFTAGELGSLVVLFAGIGDCLDDDDTWGDDCDDNSDGLIFLGVAGYLSFRIWEIVDVWAAPREHNRRYFEIKNRMGQNRINGGIIPKDGGALAIAQFSF